MISEHDENFEIIKEIKENIVQERLILNKIKKLHGLKHVEDNKIISTQIKDLSEDLKKLNLKVNQLLKNLNLPKNFFQHILGITRILNVLKKQGQGLYPDELEKKTLKRLKEREKKEKEKIIKKDNYSKLANKLFSNYSNKLVNKNYFETLKKNLKKSNLKYTPAGYISIIFLTTFLSIIIGLVVFLFFLFFKIEPSLPIIKLAEDISSRVGKLIWILIVVPLGGFLIIYLYPSLEKKSSETQIDYELPFATINMAAISGSMINPVKIFEIIVSTEEFPYIKKEFTKLINEINVYGYDIVSALRSVAANTPSQKLTELLNGLAITINSGGDLEEFFNKRAESLLFEYKLNREKETKTAETFMDIYISVVIAAPMIFMLLLMMMKISGLGVSMSTSTLTLLIVTGVSIINVIFIGFLHLKGNK